MPGTANECQCQNSDLGSSSSLLPEKRAVVAQQRHLQRCRSQEACCRKGPGEQLSVGQLCFSLAQDIRKPLRVAAAISSSSCSDSHLHETAHQRKLTAVSIPAVTGRQAGHGALSAPLPLALSLSLCYFLSWPIFNLSGF